MKKSVQTDNRMSNRVGYAQIVTKSDAEISRLSQVITDAQARQEQAENALMDIRERAAARRKQITDLHGGLQDFERQLEQAKSYATMAEGTLLEKESLEAIRTLEGYYQAQHERTQKAELAATHEEAEETQQLADLEAVRCQAEKELAEAQKLLPAVEGTKQKAWTQLGEAERADVQTRIDTYQHRINDLRSALMMERLAFENYLRDDALPRIDEWTEHLTEIRKLLPYSDDFTHILEGEVAMLEALTTHPELLPRILQVREMAYYGGNVADLLKVPLEEIYSLWRGNSTALKARLSHARQTLEEYRMQVK